MQSKEDFKWTDKLVKDMIWQKLPIPEHYTGNLQKCLDEFKGSEYASQFQSPEHSRDVEQRGEIKDACKKMACKFIEWYVVDPNEEVTKALMELPTNNLVEDVYDYWLTKYFNPETSKSKWA